MNKPIGTTDRDELPTADLSRIADLQARLTAELPDPAGGDGGSGIPRATVPLASPTAALQVMDATTEHEPATGAHDKTGALPPSATDIDLLAQRVAADPHDVDALFKLAVALHRAGRTAQARTALTSLAQVYRDRGQPAQATRILDMLAAPATAKLATARLDAGRPGTGRLGTGELGFARDSTTHLRQTGRLSPGQTVVLRQSALLGQAGAGAEPEAEEPPVPFPPSALTFTIPLPGEED